MKKYGFVSLIYCCSLTLLLFTGSVSWADDLCYQIVSNAYATADIPFAQYSGHSEVEMNGQIFLADVNVIITNMTTTDDGTYHLETETEFYVGLLDSLIFAKEKVVLSPTDEEGIYRINSRMIITDGTGYFDGVFGKLLPHGNISFVTQEFTVTAKGKICF